MYIILTLLPIIMYSNKVGSSMAEIRAFLIYYIHNVSHQSRGLLGRKGNVVVSVRLCLPLLYNFNFTQIFT